MSRHSSGGCSAASGNPSGEVTARAGKSWQEIEDPPDRRQPPACRSGRFASRRCGGRGVLHGRWTTGHRAGRQGAARPGDADHGQAAAPQQRDDLRRHSRLLGQPGLGVLGPAARRPGPARPAGRRSTRAAAPGLAQSRRPRTAPAAAAVRLAGRAPAIASGILGRRPRSASPSRIRGHHDPALGVDAACHRRQLRAPVRTAGDEQAAVTRPKELDHVRRSTRSALAIRGTSCPLPGCVVKADKWSTLTYPAPCLPAVRARPDRPRRPAACAATRSTFSVVVPAVWLPLVAEPDRLADARRIGRSHARADVRAISMTGSEGRRVRAEAEPGSRRSCRGRAVRPPTAGRCRPRLLGPGRRSPRRESGRAAACGCCRR